MWSGEFPAGVHAHLHFLVFQRDASHGITLGPTGQQYFWGILYNPGNYAGGGGCASACALSISGRATNGITTCGLKLTCGPPTVLGQMVADNVTIGGNLTVEVYDGPYLIGPAGTGGDPGTSLVE